MANWDESKHPRDDDGKFGSGGGVTPASELKKKPAEELTKINPWDDEKTKKMKMRLAKMHAGNQDIKDDIAKRKAHIEQMKKDNAKMKKELGINAALMPPMYVANSVQTIESDAPFAVQLAPFGEFKKFGGPQIQRGQALWLTVQKGWTPWREARSSLGRT